MKFHSPLHHALAFLALLFLAACGGSGAKVNPNLGGTLSLNPSTALFYAGVPYQMTVSGARPPYSITSSDPSLLPVPTTVNGNFFEVLGNNPGVLDPNLPTGSLPIKTVTLTARDSNGDTATATIQVGRNFLTSYQISFGACTAASSSSSTTVAAPCAGGDTPVSLDTIINGNEVGDAQFTLQIVSGTMAFVNPIGSNTVSPTYTTTSDHQGQVLAVVRVPAGTPAQVGVIRVIHVASGVSANFAFVTQGSTTVITPVPATFTFTGSLNTVCGTGSGDFFVSGGSPPYSASSSDPKDFTLTVVDANAGHFTVTAVNGNPPCPSPATIIIMDSVGGTATVTVTSSLGSGSPPAPSAISIAPTTLSLACGATGSVTVIGGTGNYSANSSTSYMTSVVAGSTVSVTRQLHDGANPPLASGSQTVTVTDGSSIASIAVTVPVNCP